jgi:hypothetical protein
MAIGGQGPRPSRGPGPSMLIMANSRGPAGVGRPSQAGRDEFPARDGVVRPATRPTSRFVSRLMSRLSSRPASRQSFEGCVRAGASMQAPRSSSQDVRSARVASQHPSQAVGPAPSQGHRLPSSARHLNQLTGRTLSRPQTSAGSRPSSRPSRLHLSSALVCLPSQAQTGSSRRPLQATGGSRQSQQVLDGRQQSQGIGGSSRPAPQGLGLMQQYSGRHGHPGPQGSIHIHQSSFSYRETHYSYHK